ncbi:MAG: hypothetical protein AAGG68_31340 [Bacteroidota bacterium]
MKVNTSVINNIAVYLFLIFFLGLSTISKAADQKTSIFDLINQEEIERASIEVDLDAITTDWRNEDKHRAVFSFKDAAGQTQIWNIKVQLRGKFRRLHCEGIPPLKVFFDKDDLQQAGLAKYDDLKLVNYCFQDDFVAKELLIKEYLAYKMYNEISAASFRVKLLKITYKDSKSSRKLKQWAFFIEDTAQMRDRLEGNKYEMAREIADNPFNRTQIQQVALFQFMIGNTDWSVVSQKNIKILEKEGTIWAIPYDFDFSGLVNPPYATPSSHYNLTSITERIYLGPLEADIEVSIKLFLDKKAALLEIIQQNRLLRGETKKVMLDYLASFYENLTPNYIFSRLPPEQYSQLD